MIYRDKKGRFISKENYQKSIKVVYRDKKGRFISKENYLKSIKVVYRDKKGRFISKENYQKSIKPSDDDYGTVSDIYYSESDQEETNVYKKNKKQDFFDYVDAIIDSDYDLDIEYERT